MAGPSHDQTAGGDALDARLGEILGLLHDRMARGETINESKLRVEYPDFADDLLGALGLVGQMRPLQNVRLPEDDIEHLIKSGLLAESSDPDYAAELGPYRIRGVLGSGGMGVVLEADEPNLERTVALKVLRPHLAHDAEALKRFRREAIAAAALKISNIVTVYAVDVIGNTHYISMEFVDGLTLADLISKNGPLPTGWCENPLSHPMGIRHVFNHLLTGLAAAHRAGLIHRDIKPSNLLLAGLSGCHGQAQRGHALSNGDAGCHGQAKRRHALSGEGQHARALPMNREDLGMAPTDSSSVTLKIADFGLARMISAETLATLPGSVLGTPQYMSPEQARGDENIDHRTDLYSAGVVLYEMLTGRTPFRADTPSAVIHQILHDDPPAPRSINDTADPHLASLALRLMAKGPDDRFESAMEVRAALPADVQVRLPAQRRRLRRAVFFALTAVAFLFAGAWLVSLVVEEVHTVAPTSEGNLPITDLQVDPRRPTVILAWRGDDPEPSVFCRLPEEVQRVTVAKFVDPDGVPSNGDEFVVAGTARSWKESCLFALSTSGDMLETRWSLSSERKWPDCDTSRPWVCRTVAVADIDGIAGDEIVAVSIEGGQYATRVSVIDPRTDDVCSTFWHLGNIKDLWIHDDFFGPGREGIVAWGYNNKLAGFYDGLQGTERRFTHWDVTTFVMVLDPRNMNGLGPPRTDRFPDLLGANPYAYAFLDMPYTNMISRVTNSGKRVPQATMIHGLQQHGAINAVARWPGTDTPEDGPWLEIAIDERGDAESWHNRAVLTVNRNLEIVDVRPVNIGGEVEGLTREFWDRYWRPIIQRGEYIAD